MPLPLSNSPWPPKDQEEPYLKMKEWAAWYSGEPMRLIDFYGALASPITRIGSPWSRFWTRNRGTLDGLQKSIMHVPIASDLAATSAAMLFGEQPRFRIKDAHENEDIQNQQTPDAQAQDSPGLPGQGPQPTRMGPPLPPQQQPSATREPVKPGFPQPPGMNGLQTLPMQKQKKPETPAQKAEARMLELVEEGEVYARLIEAAETAAGMGGVYIYPAWDKKIAEFPFIAVAQADMAVPTFRYGFLTEVIFHRVVRRDHIEGGKATVWRHLEWHYTEGEGESRKCKIEHALYKGGDDDLGQRVGLNSIQEMEGFEKEVIMPFGELDVEYVPNIRPNRLWRASGLGVADIQGSETLLDAIDETYASWMRDIRLAKARIIVPSDYLDYSRDGDGNVQASFDIDQEVYTPMEIAPNMEATATSQMLAHQFAIRWQEHKETAAVFISRVVSNAGYAYTTLGEAPDVGATAAGLRVTEHKSILTQKRKAERWRGAVARALWHLMMIDSEEFDSGVSMDLIKKLKPSVEMSDGILDNPLELAQTALAMKTAEAASTETRVRLLHPEWTDAEVASEVERIKGEVEAAKPPVPVVGPKFGDPNADPKSTNNIPRTDQTKGGAPQNAPPASPPLAKNPA